MTQPSINITALKMNAPLGVAAELSLLVTVSSPQQDPASVKERPWLNLALAIDRSSSMGGRPLAEAKSCAVRVVRGLRPGDRVAIVAYDNEVIVPVPSVIVTEEGKAAIIAAIDSFRERGNTDLHSGWLEAATQAASGIAPNVLTRVLVLSDGQTNSGIKDVAEIARQAGGAGRKGHRDQHHRTRPQLQRGPDDAARRRGPGPVELRRDRRRPVAVLRGGIRAAVGHFGQERPPAAGLLGGREHRRRKRDTAGMPMARGSCRTWYTAPRCPRW